MTSSANRARLQGDVHQLLDHPNDLMGHVAMHGPLGAAFVHDRLRGLVKSLEDSGLTGRGGGAFPTSIKLAATRSAGSGGTIIVNAMEGEPASDKDKLLLTRVPHLVLDGAQYLADVCRADRIAVCIPIGRNAVANAVSHAMAERRHAHYSRVAEEVVRPPDRFIAGEESALANWINSGRSLPAFRPDKSSSLRLGRRPLLVHNTETLAHIALIARYGPGPFRYRGTSEDPGTCLVTITGSVALPGVVEVDRGTALWDIVKRGQPVESVQALLLGGYGGTWIGPEHFGTAYASDALRTLGTNTGVGVIVALGTSRCGLAESARIARYLADQSAGQCGPCLYGLPAIADDLACLARAEAHRDTVSRLHRRLSEVDGRGACRHPDGAVSLVQSALTVFASDVAAHGRGEPCPYWRKPTHLRFPRPVAL